MLGKRILFTLVGALLMLGLSSQYAFASIVYIDGNEVWVSSDDGSVKKRLSGGENDWRQVAQSDNGYIVGVRKEAGKISQLASFTVWDPSGKVVHFGSLSGHIDAGLNVYPTSLDITADGGLLTYGYSRSYWAGTTYNLVYGSYLKATADGTTAVPLSLTGWQDATLVGNRVVAHDANPEVLLQDPSSIGSTTFAPWFSWNTSSGLLSGLEVDRTDVAATGTVLGTEFRDSSFNTQKILLTKAAALGGTYVDDCELVTSGAPSDITISQNAGTIAWHDSRGIVIAGAPDFGGGATCTLTRAPLVISATGQMPSYGPFDVAGASSGTTPGSTTPPSTTPPATTPPSTGIATTTAVKITGKLKAKKKIAAKVKVTAAKKPVGSVRITVDGKAVKTVAVKSTSWVTFKLPKQKKGVHRVVATFTGSGFASSARTLTIKVR
jgi:hypothetical protein